MPSLDPTVAAVDHLGARVRSGDCEAFGNVDRPHRRGEIEVLVVG